MGGVDEQNPIDYEEKPTTVIVDAANTYRYAVYKLVQWDIWFRMFRIPLIVVVPVNGLQKKMEKHTPQRILFGCWALSQLYKSMERIGGTVM